MPRLSPPPAVLEIAERLENAGFEAWCVGGAIRDALLGHPDLDWDLATSATPDQVRQLFGHKRTIPVGIAFGTVGVLDRANTMHEVTTFRRDVRTDGRHAEVEFGVSLEDDLARRDFTINAIAYSPKRDELRDPFGGRADLARRLVRAVGDPDARMREDRLRALRAIRFAARFDFALDPATLVAIEASAPHLGRLSAERVKQELDKTMEQVRRPSTALLHWRETGAFRTLVPQLADVSEQTLRIADYAAMPGVPRRPARRAIRFAALLSELSGREAAKVMTNLRSSKHEIHAVEALVDRWRSFGGDLRDLLSRAAPPSDAEVRRSVARVGRLHLGAFMRLASAAWCAEGGGAPGQAAVGSLYRRMLRAAFDQPVDIGSLAIDGDDLRGVGIQPGPALGKILQALLDVVIDDPARNTADWLLQEAKRLHEQAGSGDRRAP
ncbi:MAG TPA: CCA tRNA nucleotidyltransferase [Gemmatimonadaceae bacterium]|nr:CCA tRNA nucleotidyltransferase [Gemmatimonadaceae bacterium]